MAERDDRGERRHHARVELHVDLVYDSLSSFRAAAGGNLSRSGMFLSIANPPPVGSLISFEARLRDGESLIRGEGQVVWIRGPGASDGRPPGVAIRFLRLTQAGKQLIDELVSRHQAANAGVRLDGVRLEAGPPSPGQPLEPGRPPGSDRRPSPEGPAGPPEAAPPPAPAGKVPGGSPARPVRPERPVRVTDRGGVGFDFTLVPGDSHDAPLPAARLGPERKILLAVVLLVTIVGALLVGPGRLIAHGQRVVGLLVGLFRSAAPTRVEPVASPPATAPSPEEDSPEPAPEATPVPADGGGLLVKGVAWRREERGIEISIELSSPVLAEAVSHSRMAGPDRYVVRITGVTSYEGRPVLEVGGREVSRIRVGLHRDREPPELHVVLDLAADTVEVEPQPIRGSLLAVRVRSRR